MFKKLIVLVLLCGSMCASAAPIQPSCWPKDVGGSGSKMVVGETTNQHYVGWICQAADKSFTYVGAVGLKKTKVQIPAITKLNLQDAARKVWDENVKYDITLPAYKEGLDALKKDIAGQFVNGRNPVTVTP